MGITWEGEVDPGDQELGVDQADGSFHRGRRKFPTPPPYGWSKKMSRSSQEVMTTVTLPMSMPWVTAPSARSAKNSMYAKITAAIT